METQERTEQKNITSKVITITGILLCVVFSLMLICNITIIIKGSVSPERPPSVLGVTPLVVLSGSMSGDAPDHIEIGDLIFVTGVDVSKLEEGNVITFMEGKSVVTHRIIGITTGEDGKLLFTTKGDFNNGADDEPVHEDDVIGIYRGRIPKVGDLAMFMQSPLGMVVFIGVPLLAFLAYDMVRRQKFAVADKEKTAELEAELARLRAMAAEKENKQEDQPADPEN